MNRRARITLAGLVLAGVIIGAAEPGIALARVPLNTAPASQVPAASANSVAIVIAGVGVGCVPWHSGISSDTVLNDVATVTYRASDHLITQIDGQPANGIATDNHYWAYWHLGPSGWQYSNVGASGYFPKPGSVDGWAFGGGTSTTHPKPPVRSYTSICAASRPPAPPRSSASRHSSSPAPPTTSARASRIIHSSTHPAPPPTRASRAPSTHRTATATAPTAAVPDAATPSSAAAPTSSSSDLVTLPLRTAASRRSPGSVVPSVLGISLVALVVAGTALLAWRRRRAAGHR